MENKNVRHILAIEDCPESLLLIRSALGPLYEVRACANGKDARDYLAKGESPALILLDISLPDGDGLKLFSLLRSEELLKELPVIVVSGQTDIANKVAAFSLGVEDFVTKPFHPSELRARIEARLRRHEEQMQASTRKLRCGDLIIDIERQSAYFVHTPETPIDVTPKEFRLLCALSRANGRILSREQLLEEAWGNTRVADRAIDTHLSRLRNKLRGNSVHIEAVPGQGYHLVAAVPQAVRA